MKDLKREKEFISRDGYQKLCEKYIEIDQELANVLKAMGESAKREGTSCENVEYISLRTKAMHILPNQKRKLYDRQRSSIIIEDTEEYKNFDGKTVIIGSEVELIIDGEIEKYKILGNSEGELKEGIIACSAPIAKAVINRQVGETVEFNCMSITIKSVKRV